MKPQSERLGTEPIPKLLGQLALPAMVGMFVMAFYNVVDTLFVSWAVGTIGVAAVSIAFPVQMLIMALAGAIGIGGSSVISRALGAGDVEKANQVFGNIIAMVILVSLIGLLLGLTYLTPILYFFGSSDTILPYAEDYLGIILYGTLFFAFAFSMNNVIRSEGNAKTAMTTMIISAGLNMILTPLFIFGFNMGVKGSALATVLSQAVTAVYLVYYFSSGKSSLTFHLANLIPRLSLIKQILSIGSSSFVQQASSSIMFIVANRMLIFHGGDLAVAVFGIIHKIMMFSFMPTIGIVQGLLPIVGYNYGAKKPERVSAGITLAIKASTGIISLFFIIVMLFPKGLMMIFTHEPEAVAMGSTALRIMFSLSFTIGIQVVVGAVFQALGKARAALILSLSRQVLFLIPMILLLPSLSVKFGLPGVYGIWTGFPAADLLALCLTLFFVYNHREIFTILRSRHKVNE